MNALKNARKLKDCVGLLGLKTNYFSTCSPKLNEKVYEVRKYQINPKDVKPFVELSNQWMHLRLGHSKLIGYWVMEVGGGINDMVHIWEYDSLSHRAKVRHALAGDPEWVANYFSKILPMMQKQENALYRCFPGTSVLQCPGKGVYEIQMLAGGTGLDAVKEAVGKLQRTNATLLGSFYNVLGIGSLYMLLWHHPTLENVTETSTEFDKSSGISMVVSSLMLPTPWSPMN